MRAAWLAVVLAIGCGSKAPPPASDQPAPLTELADSCTTADDCDLVDACCGCNAGGKKMAIRKDAVAGFLSTREQRCGDTMCAQVIRL
jgi:hypothetical protein